MRLLKTHLILDLFYKEFYKKTQILRITPMLLFLLVLTVSFVINYMFAIDTVYCAEETQNVYAPGTESKGKSLFEQAFNIRGVSN